MQQILWVTLARVSPALTAQHTKQLLYRLSSELSAFNEYTSPLCLHASLVPLYFLCLRKHTHTQSFWIDLFCSCLACCIAQGSYVPSLVRCKNLPGRIFFFLQFCVFRSTSVKCFHLYRIFYLLYIRRHKFP